MTKIKNIIWNVLCILSITLLISFASSKLITGWSSFCGYRVFYIMSESMEPEIMTGQLAVGKYVPDDETPEIGEIYVYRSDSILGRELIIHRLIAVTKDGRYQFKGDNNRFPDAELVDREEIGYKVVVY